MTKQSLDDIIWLLWKGFDELAEELWHSPEGAKEVVNLAIISSSSKAMAALSPDEEKLPVINATETQKLALEKIVQHLRRGTYDKMAKRLEKTNDIDVDMSDIVRYPQWPLLFFAFYNETNDSELMDLVLAAKPDMSVVDSNWRNILMKAITHSTSYTRDNIITLLSTMKKMFNAWINIMQTDNDWKTVLDIIRERCYWSCLRDDNLVMIYDLIRVYTDTYWPTRKQIYTKKVVEELKKSRLTEMRDFWDIIEKTWNVNELNAAWDTLLSTLILEKKYDLIKNLCWAWADPIKPFNGGNWMISPISYLENERWDEEKKVHALLVKQAENIKRLHIAAELMEQYQLYSEDADRMIRAFDIDARDLKTWLTPFMKIVMNWNMALIKALELTNPNTGAVDENWFSALMIAAWTWKMDLVECVLAVWSPADIEIKNFQFLTAQEMAKKLWYIDIAERIDKFARDWESDNDIPF
ncbi:MAG: hypothetical protein ACD_3C00109G0006 [uncultured bacterium (gcode 4)]|uniref:Uncharacterized protein n=1 Tax=uncultured bacterium (gcode 4) TaxID=1234023 RepID=K2G1D4_9BACT|nr:MAG: hypothetical protein ACD_3C00109G0006 [uncultured bacterium (gcode 4)]